MYLPLSIVLHGEMINGLTPVKNIPMSQILSADSEVDLVANQIMFEYSEINENMRPKLVNSLEDLVQHLATPKSVDEESKIHYLIFNIYFLNIRN